MSEKIDYRTLYADLPDYVGSEGRMPGWMAMEAIDWNRSKALRENTRAKLSWNLPEEGRALRDEMESDRQALAAAREKFGQSEKRWQEWEQAEVARRIAAEDADTN